MPLNLILQIFSMTTSLRLQWHLENKAAQIRAKILKSVERSEFRHFAIPLELIHPIIYLLWYTETLRWKLLLVRCGSRFRTKFFLKPPINVFRAALQLFCPRWLHRRIAKTCSRTASNPCAPVGSFFYLM
jgi:hypothetical protein